MVDHSWYLLFSVLGGGAERKTGLSVEDFLRETGISSFVHRMGNDLGNALGNDLGNGLVNDFGHDWELIWELGGSN